MTDTAAKIIKKAHEYSNGKKLSESSYVPTDFLNEIRCAITHQQLPRENRNKKPNHRPNLYIPATNITNTIFAEYLTLTQKLNQYTDETPYNQMAHWGALFRAAQKYYTNIKKCGYINPLEISESEIKSIPTKYMDAIFQKANGKYMLNQRRTKQKYTFIFASDKSALRFNELCEMTAALIPLILNPHSIQSQYRTKNPHEMQYYCDVYEKDYDYVTRNTSIRQNYFISDMQLFAIQQLRQIFLEMAKICLILEHKNGAVELFKEYKNEQNNKNRILRAQQELNAKTPKDYKTNPYSGQKYIIEKMNIMSALTENMNQRKK